VDVTDAPAVSAALGSVRETLGEVTGVLHGAGGNTPRSLASMGWAQVRDTMAPKVDGLANLLAALDPGRLKLLVTFGSVIGRFGLWGEAHYAMANAELARMTQEFAAAHPGCRTSCLEWSVWSEVGMGARLDVVDSLRRTGIIAIDPATGTGILGRALADPQLPAVVVVSGRTDQVSTARYARAELPLVRFVEHVKRYYPRHELVAEAVLSPELDPYLDDHVLDGNALLPAVFGMEAMAQVGMALQESGEPPRMEDIRFLRPLVVPASGGLRIRISAVARDGHTLAVSISSEETDFSTPHFSARLVFDGRQPVGLVEGRADDGPGVAIDPQTELYGGLLFQGRRFQRLRSFQLMTSRQVEATVEPDPGVRWFAGHLPAGLVLADPGVRDALMHGNQVCIPDSTLLPEGVDAITTAASRADGPLTFRSVEREHGNNLHVYDVEVTDRTGAVVETWQGLRLRAVRTRLPESWPVPLLGPHLERVLAEGGLAASVTATAGPGDDLELRVDGPGVIGGRAVPLNGEYADAQSSDAMAVLQLEQARAALVAAGVDTLPVRRGQARGAEEFVAGTHRVYLLVAHPAGQESPHLLTIVTKEDA
jgi:enediyne polyketide synthase